MSGIDAILTSVYADVASAAVLTYDVCLTMDLEITLIWPSTFSFVKVLYFLTRYSSFIDVALVLYYEIKPDISYTACKIIHYVEGVTMILGIAVAEVIIVIRTYAFCGRPTKWRRPLEIVSAVSFATVCICEGIYLHSQTYQFSDDPHMLGCRIKSGSSIGGVEFAFVILFETAVVALTLYKHAIVWRNDGVHSVISIAAKDGVFYYVCLLAFSLTNIIIILAVPSHSSLLSLFQRVMHSVLTSRVILHLREANEKDLHSSFLTTLASMRVEQSTSTDLEMSDDIT